MCHQLPLCSTPQAARRPRQATAGVGPGTAFISGRRHECRWPCTSPRRGSLKGLAREPPAGSAGTSVLHRQSWSSKGVGCSSRRWQADGPGLALYEAPSLTAEPARALTARTLDSVPPVCAVDSVPTVLIGQHGGHYRRPVLKAAGSLLTIDTLRMSNRFYAETCCSA